MPTRRALLVLLVACGCGGRTGAAPSTPTPTDGITCWRGSVTTQGAPAPTLVRRTVDAAQHRVVEEVATTNDDGSVAEYQVTFVVADDGSFAMSEAHDAFAGEGRFTAGAPWQWTAWTSTARGGGGGWTATSTDVITGDTLTVEKRIELTPPPYMPEGGGPAVPQVIETREHYTTFACTDYPAERAALEP